MDKQRELQAVFASTNKTNTNNEVKQISKTQDKRNDGGYIWII